jgi:hypothetical protein
MPPTMTTLQFCPTVLASTSYQPTSGLSHLIPAPRTTPSHISPITRYARCTQYPRPPSQISPISSYSHCTHTPLSCPSCPPYFHCGHPSFTPFPVPPYSPSCSRYTHNTLSRYSAPVFSQPVVSRPIPTTSTLLFHISPCPTRLSLSPHSPLTSILSHPTNYIHIPL